MERWTETVSPDAVPSPIRILSPGCEVGDRYEVRRVLGMGGSGVVYAVFDRQLRRDVALKVLRSDRMTESALKRFRREVAVARDAQSPHLVRVFDMDQSADSIYLTMELVEGESLATRLERGPLPVAEVVAIGSQILAALEALHGFGIVHRDIKPSNVMITSDGVVKVTDFGLARRMDSETRATETQAVVGTYEYLSPEQALGGEVDMRSDLYSFGILLYECLTGDVPLRSGSSLGTVIAHLSKAVPDVRSLSPNTPRWLAAMIARLLEKRPLSRYQTAGAVLRDLTLGRVPFRVVRPTRLWVLLAAALLVIGLGFGYRELGRRKFAQFVHDGAIGAKALDSRGAVLWSHPLMEPVNRATAFVTAGDRRLIAGLVADPRIVDPVASHRLLLVDPDGGNTERTIDLPSLAHLFPAFSGSFAPCRMTAVDIDHDGAQEIVVSYCHHPYFPSYSIFVDPEQQTAFPILIASGHHRFLGQIDIDGDGRDELLFWGPSNRLGWYTGVAAVRVVREQQRTTSLAVASTPDQSYSATSGRALLWYALVGKGGYDHGTEPRLDKAKRQIVIDYGDGSHSRLGLDGFEIGATDSQERAIARARAYEAMRLAVRHARNGYAGNALERADQAVVDADRARDVPLGVWARRVRIKVLIKTGHGDRIEPLLKDVMGRFNSPSDACWEVASEFHLRGELIPALHWYDQGLRLLPESSRGRVSWEYLEGTIFALAEMGRWDEARRTAETYSIAFPQTVTGTSHYRAWIDWRATGRFREPVAGNGGLADFARYTALEEFAQRPDTRPETLLKRLNRELSRASEPHRSALLSLKAEALARAGDRKTALAIAAQSMAGMRAQLSEDYTARALMPVVAERYAALADAAGDPSTARAIRNETAAFYTKTASSGRM